MLNRLISTSFQRHSLWSLVLFVFLVLSRPNSQTVNLSLYAKPSAKNQRRGWQQPEDLRKIRHFSTSNLNIFKEYGVCRAKNRSIFQQIHTFPLSNFHNHPPLSRKNLMFHAKAATRIRVHPCASVADSRPLNPSPPPPISAKLNPLSLRWRNTNAQCAREL
jgi:hypothetical protein